MAPHLADPIPHRLSMWQRVRTYAVPPTMIENATARRAVGDWAGACAAARVDVDLDPRAVRQRHGGDVLNQLRGDLRRLAPDLLRWHMPRIAPDGRLRPGLTLSLARYRGAGAVPLHLVVRTPPARADGGQRMSLALWEGPGSAGPGYHPHPHPDRRFRLDLHRHLWDAARSGELARRCGALGAASGVPATSGVPGPTGPARPGGFAHGSAHGFAPSDRWAVARWADEAERLLRAEGRPRGAFTVRLGAGDRAVFALVAPDDSHAPTLRPSPEALPAQVVAALPVLPEAAARVLPDLELLRAGLIAAERLHPLVAAALAVPGAVWDMGSDVGSDVDPAPDPGDPHRVECRGETHRIALRDGVLTAIDHDPALLRREELLVALGGPPLPCLRAIDAAHRSPQALPAVRQRLHHGDVDGALAVVEGLLGPDAVLRDGPLRQEWESAAARHLDHGLFRAGLLAEYRDAGVAAGPHTSGTGHTGAGHRPRIDRRTPPAVRRKRASRVRPRTGLFG